MTQRLEQAIAAVRDLPADAQDTIAESILDEIEDERRWDETFARSESELSKLAEGVRKDVSAGRVKDLRMQ